MPADASAPRGSLVGACLAWALSAAVAVGVVFAPVVSVGWCNDGPTTSACFSEHRSMLGVTTDPAIWLGVTAVAVVVAVTLALVRGRR